jgi:Spy/CpxP family protein refolding chaperone
LNKPYTKPDLKKNNKEENPMLGKSKMKMWMVGGALLAMSSLAFAAGPGFGRGNNPNCPGGFDQLNLTAEQKTKLSELREKTWKETATLRNEMQAKRLELRTLWAAPNPDKGSIQDKQNQLNDLRNKLQAKMTDSRLEARQHLTTEQAAQMAACGPGMGFGGGGMHRMGRMGRGNCDGPGGAGSGPCGGPCGGPGQGPGPGGARL